MTTSADLPTITKSVFTAGYQGHSVDDLQSIAEFLDATVVDIRFAPYSKNPAWGKDALRQTLGNRYRHVHALGNKNYRNGGDIEILNLVQGALDINNDRRGTVILLCVCKDYDHCHRRVVVEALGLEKQEINWGLADATF